MKPTLATFTAAAAAGDWAGAQNFAVNLIDLPGPTTWPIVSATFVLLPKDPKDAAKSRRRDEVLRLGLHERRRHRDGPRLHRRCRQPCRTASAPPGAQDVMANGQPVWK